MRLYFPLVLLACLICQLAHADDGIIRVPGIYSASESIDILESVLKTKSMTVFMRISHSQGARKTGFDLRPTELLVLGNPKVGTPLMMCSQSAALELPQRALAYQDANGRVWLSYTDPYYIAARHLFIACEDSNRKIRAALAAFTALATQ
jgi:uncharacterized protein (DUF302 family)